MTKRLIAIGKRLRTSRGVLPVWEPPLNVTTIRGVRKAAQRVFEGVENRSVTNKTAQAVETRA